MPRLVVVSNRVAIPGEQRAGGLASALHAALSEHGGLWFGWSGKRVREAPSLHDADDGAIRYGTLDLSFEDHDAYYNGFANRTLWPLLHFRPDLVDYRREGWVDAVRTIAPRGVDVVIDMVGGEQAEQGLRLLAWRGRFIVVGFAGGTIPKLPANRLLLNSASAIGVIWGVTRQREPELAQQVFADLFELLAKGRIRPILTRSYPLAEAAQAMKDLAGRRTTGKVVLVP